MPTFGQRASKRQERRAAASLGGRTTKASGGTDSPSHKGDVRVQGDVRVEAKTTSYARYSLKISDWHKIQSQAAMFGEEPVMQIEFQGDLGQNTKLAIISWDTYLQLRESAE